MGHGSKAGPACLALGHHQAGPVLGASGGNQEEGFGKYEPVCVRKAREEKEKRARRKEEREDGREETKPPSSESTLSSTSRDRSAGGRGRHFTPSTADRSVIINMCRLISQRPRRGRGNAMSSPGSGPPRAPRPTRSPQTPTLEPLDLTPVVPRSHLEPQTPPPERPGPTPGSGKSCQHQAHMHEVGEQQGAGGLPSSRETRQHEERKGKGEMR